MLRRRFFIVMVGLLAAAMPMLLTAQQKSKSLEAQTASVSGQVTCADTNAPARLAIVSLERLPDESKTKSADSHEEHEESAGELKTDTDLNGRFYIGSVPPGRYYVLGKFDGYASPYALIDGKDPNRISEEARKQLAATILIVSIDASRPATVNLRLERSPEISGTVLYDDGGSAAALKLRLIRKADTGSATTVNPARAAGEMAFWGSEVMTDAHGRFRMVGMPAGEYALKVSLPMEQVEIGGLLSGNVALNVHPNGGLGLPVYSGNKFRASDATFTVVEQNSQTGSFDITIPLAGLHSIRGSVTAKRDGHALNAGEVHLLYADTHEELMTVYIQADGSFMIPYAPEDHYILQESKGRDTEMVQREVDGNKTFEEKVLRAYADAELSIFVQGEVTGAALSADDSGSKK
jgi:hypothetical protein